MSAGEARARRGGPGQPARARRRAGLAALGAIGALAAPAGCPADDGAGQERASGAGAAENVAEGVGEGAPGGATGGGEGPGSGGARGASGGRAGGGEGPGSSGARGASGGPPGGGESASADPEPAADPHAGDAPPGRQSEPDIFIDEDGVKTTVYDAPELPTPRLLPVPEVSRRVRADEATLCDVNTTEAREHFGVIPGATLLSHPTRFDSGELPADRERALVFYCSTPSCGASLRAGTRALLAGYEEVYAMRDGIAGWIEAGEDTAPVGAARERASHLRP